MAGVSPTRVRRRGASARPASGTGFIVAEGKMLTNNHVVDECGRDGGPQRRRARAAPPGSRPTDRRRDLALLTVRADAGPALTFRDSPPAQRGEAVITYGFPLSGLLSSGPT